MAISIKRLCFAVAFVLCAVANSSHAQPPANPGQFDFFERKIRPVLIASCYECHSASSKKIKGGFLLDTREGMLIGGDNGPAIVPGDVKKSLLIVGIRHESTNPRLAMPPKKPKLPESVIADFELWVKMGAPDPRSGKAVAKSTPAKAGDHWAFKKIANPPVPKIDARNPIDSFIRAKLNEKKLNPSPTADRHTLIRRVTYDLTGLPPTPEDVDAFLADPAANAFEKVVDRLLASPRYGERWGRHWLDIARYADTTGDRGGGARTAVYPFAWTYRDYVIDAFNKDLPFDRFILEQIAADRLSETKQDKMRLAALGFLTVGKRFMNNANDVIDDRIDVVTRGLMGLTGACARCHDHKFDPISTQDYYALHGIFNSSEESRNTAPLFDPKTNPDYADYLAEAAKIEQEAQRYSEAEAARVVAGMLQDPGSYLLGAEDWFRGPGATKKGGTSYFGMRAYLKTGKKGLQLELAYPWYVRIGELKASKKTDPVFGPWLKFAALRENKFGELGKEIAGAADVNPALAQALAAKNPTSLKEVAAVYTDVFSTLNQQLKPERWHANAKLPFDIKPTQRVLADPALEALREHLFGKASPIMPDDAILTRSQFLFPRNKQAILSQVVSLDLTHPGAPVKAMALADKAVVKNSPVFIRGEPDNLGPIVPRRFLTVLAGDDPKPFSDGSGRLELARAIVSRDNPLTARVLVNRVWQWHFGQPIVRTVSDFGTRSEPPTHPKLLDWLATSFMDNGWSLKKLHKLILTSATYQQQSLANKASTEIDPTNQWLWRYNIRRLDFEEVRDTLLVVGRSLDPTMGGPPFNLGAMGPSMGKSRLGADFSGIKNNAPDRRTVYALIDRSGLPEVFNTFDFADPDMSTGERIQTTVPQQALFMMNSPFVAQQVKNLLARPDFPAKGNDDDKVRFLFRVTFQRGPREQELQLARNFLSSASKTTPNRDGGLNVWERYSQVLLLTNELHFVK